MSGLRTSHRATCGRSSSAPRRGPSQPSGASFDLRRPRPDSPMYRYVLEKQPSRLTHRSVLWRDPDRQRRRAEDVEICKTTFCSRRNPKRFLVSGIVEAGGREGIPHNLTETGEVSGLLQPADRRVACPLPSDLRHQPTRGHDADVRQKLDVAALQDNGLDGSGVGLAIVDSGIYVPRIKRLLGDT